MSSNTSCQAAVSDLLSCLKCSAFNYFSAVDWASEAKYISAAILTAAFILVPLFYVAEHPPNWLTSFLDRVPALIPKRLKNLFDELQNFNPGETRFGRLMGFSSPTTRPRRVYVCGPRVIYDALKDFSRRIDISRTNITIFAYPSRGGVIVLSPAYAPDFDFLGLDRLNPPQTRFITQNEEDEFCKNMLLLGAKWWDSLSRYYLVRGAQQGEEDCEEALEYDDTVPKLTVRERLWCSVAWHSTGGLVVAEYHDTRLGFMEDRRREYNIPDDIGRLALCADMDDRAAILKERLDGKWFASLEEDVEEGGDGFLGAWAWKSDGRGEVGVMEKTW